jgi:hypothetical protein
MRLLRFLNFRSHICSLARPPFTPPRRPLDRSRVFALFFWRRLPVLDLTEGDIGKQLSELIGVARAFLASGASRQIGPC